MPRYIDADVLTVAVYDAYDDIPEIHDRGIVISEKFRRLIDAQKTIDVVPVVRCKDCRRHEEEELGMVYCMNAMIVGGWVPEGWFCADGERKEDGTNDKP